MQAREKERSLEKIAAAWAALGEGGARMRVREAAAKLGFAEAELVASEGGSRLLEVSAAAEWLSALIASGPFMWLARTESTVLEVDAALAFSAAGSLCTLRGPQLRILLNTGNCRFAFVTSPARGPSRVVQLFDRTGTAILKIFLKAPARNNAVDALLAPWSVDKPAVLDVVETPTPVAEPGDAEARRALRRELEEARDTQTPLLLAIENGGCLFQVAHRPRKLIESAPWYNILDRGFNLHVQEDLIVGHRPGRDGSGRATLTFLEAGGRAGLALTKGGFSDGEGGAS